MGKVRSCVVMHYLALSSTVSPILANIENSYLASYTLPSSALACLDQSYQAFSFDLEQAYLTLKSLA
jgi:hypothetical protein